MNVSISSLVIWGFGRIDHVLLTIFKSFTPWSTEATTSSVLAEVSFAILAAGTFKFADLRSILSKDRAELILTRFNGNNEILEDMQRETSWIVSGARYLHKGTVKNI